MASFVVTFAASAVLGTVIISCDLGSRANRSRQEGLDRARDLTAVAQLENQARRRHLYLSGKEYVFPAYSRYNPALKGYRRGHPVQACIDALVTASALVIVAAGNPNGGGPKARAPVMTLAQPKKRRADETCMKSGAALADDLRYHCSLHADAADRLVRRS